MLSYIWIFNKNVRVSTKQCMSVCACVYLQNIGSRIRRGCIFVCNFVNINHSFVCVCGCCVC